MTTSGASGSAFAVAAKTSLEGRDLRVPFRLYAKKNSRGHSVIRMLGAIFGDVRDELREFEIIYATNISHKEHKKYRCNEASIYKHVKKKKEERKIKLAQLRNVCKAHKNRRGFAVHVSTEDRFYLSPLLRGDVRQVGQGASRFHHGSEHFM